MAECQYAYITPPHSLSHIRVADMMHLLAFNGSLAQNASYAQVAGVADGAFPRNQANDYLLPKNMKVLASHVIGVTTFKAQIQAPSLRIIAFPELYPLNITARTTVPDMNRIQTYGEYGPRALMNESIGIYASENNTGASPTSAALWVADQFDPAPPGMQICLVATVTPTLVDGAWVLGTLTFDTQLGVGEYTVVGMACVAASAIYARLVFPGDTSYRPGCPVDALNTKVQYRDMFRNGRMGVFGKFQFNAPPQLEVFGSAAGAQACRVLLDVIKR